MVFQAETRAEFCYRGRLDRMVVTFAVIPSRAGDLLVRGRTRLRKVPRSARDDSVGQPDQLILHSSGRKHGMSGVRVLVGTRKGAFVMTADGKRERWDVTGPHFPGWEMYHLKGSPADPERIYASQSSGWFGQLIQRSDDGGKTWEPMGNQFQYEGTPGTHQWYDGTQHPWKFARVWHLEPSLDRSRHGLCRRGGRGPVPHRRRRADLARAPRSQGARLGAVLAARCRRHVPAHDPPGPHRSRSGSSSPSRPPARSGATTAAPPGSRSTADSSPRAFPVPKPRSDTACTGSRCTPLGPVSCSCRSTGT